ncbi:MAG: amidohydrolase family protein [Propionibacteriaceae bacterium]|jgi:N-acyl-D-amino-acid deacylase|nr:amidohydrolase family protein [Propionibacteriaceae bacterium]
MIAEIAPVGHLTTTGPRLDGGGRIALPGLIDAHAHVATAVFDPEIQRALLRQGVTAVIVGQDGIGAAPTTAASAAWSSAYFASIDGPVPLPGGGTVAQWLAAYDHTVPLNVAVTVPHGTLRYGVTGPEQRVSTPDEVRRLVAGLRQGLADGAVGLSTGLEYVPAAWADRAELAALMGVLAETGRPHSSHMRGYEALAPTAVAELLDLADGAGRVPLHIAHYHGDAATLVPLVDEAVTRGYDVTFDSYLYLKGCSILAMVALPRWLPLADPAATLYQLADPATRDRLAGHLATLDDLWPRTTLAWVPGIDPVTRGNLHWAEGMTVPEVARRLGVPPAEAALRMLVASGLRASCVFAQPPTNSAASVRALADHARHMAGSDSIYAPVGADAAESAGRPHPRGWGALVRYLTLARDGEWTWAEAVDHTSARAARRFGLGGRGGLAVGCPADLALVDPAGLADHATYETPRAVATGIDDVLVAGVPVLAAGELTGATPGTGLRWHRPRPR